MKEDHRSAETQLFPVVKKNLSLTIAQRQSNT